MEEPLNLLVETLEMRGLSLEEMALVATLSHPLAILDMAEWVLNHPGAAMQEMIKEKIRLIKQYELD